MLGDLPVTPVTPVGFARWYSASLQSILVVQSPYLLTKIKWDVKRLYRKLYVYVHNTEPDLGFFPGMNLTNGPQYWKIALHDEQITLAQAHVSL